MQNQFFTRLFITMLCAIFLFGCKEDKAINDDNVITVNDADTVETTKTETDKLAETGITDTLKLVFVIDSLRTLDDYKDNISRIRKVLDAKSEPTDYAVESIIPLNEKEFRFFYGLTYSTSKGDWLFFDGIIV
ncbi:hypothetical protein ABS768_10105 [Flavobacterium sp. ST-75]|uniref:Uncharacterized protein n=1 Tax=Flavobacterium rhizophilum TaxID=3163296 RepID=A0ABW8YCA1_9FLAO